MIKQIDTMEMPEWLQADKFTFNIKNILTDSFYYPACRFDGDPIKHFLGNVFSYVYADYSVKYSEFDKEVELGLRGYKVIHREKLTRRQLAPNGWNIRVHLTSADRGRRLPFPHERPFAEWVIYERLDSFTEEHNPKRCSFLFICAEGVSAYQALYLENKIAPKMLGIIQPGTGMGGNWTDFYDEEKIFARSVLYENKRENFPKYLVVNRYRSHDGESEVRWSKYANLKCSATKFVNNHGDRTSYWSNYDGKLEVWELNPINAVELSE